MTRGLTRILGGAVVRLAVLALTLVFAGCFGDLSAPGAVEGTVEIVGTGAAALSAGTVQWINGTYGAGCVGRAGSWSARVSGNAAMDNPALTVALNNTACTLTVTSIVTTTPTTYTASPSIAMTGSYQNSASTSTASVTLTATKDSYVTDGTGADTNYGTDTVLALKEAGANLNRNDWVSFDTSNYSGITSATLQLYLTYVANENTNNIPASVYYAPTAADSWGETALTWNNAPSPPGNTPASPIASQNLNNANMTSWISWDATSSVSADTDGTATFVVSAWAGGNTGHFLTFCSREGAHPPQLQLTYGPGLYMNAKLSATSFASNFTISLLVSDDPSLGTGAVTETTCATTTPVWLTGFESGAVSTAGSGLFNLISGTATADQSVTRSGNFALKVVKANGSNSYAKKTFGGTPTILVMRVAIRVNTLPGADQGEFFKVTLTAGANLNFGYNNASKKFTMGYAGGTMQSGPTGGISAGLWYRLDFRINVSANPNTIDWQVNGVAQTQATMAQAATTIAGSVHLGSSVSTDVFTAWYDDVVADTKSSDYPFRDGHGLFLIPSSWSSSTDPHGYMQTQASAAVGASSYSSLDSFPMTSTTNYIQQTTGSATDYYSVFGFPSVTNTSCINGVSSVIGLSASGSTADTVTSKMCYGGSCTTIHNDTVANTTIQYRSKFFAPPNGASIWNSTILSGTTGQIGYSRGDGNIPRWHGLLLEYDQAPRSSTAYSSVITADSPIAYWRLGDTSGTTAAATVGAINGTYTGSPTLGMGGFVNDGDTSVSFPSQSYIDFGTSSTFAFTNKATFSVECWINPVAASSLYPTFISRFDTGGSGWAFQEDSTPGGIAFTRWQSGSVNSYADTANAGSPPSVVPGQWYYVVGTYDGTNVRLYLNGVLEDTETSNFTIPANASDHLLVAGQVVNQLDYFAGGVDEVAIYNVALSQAQVTAHYNAGKP